MTHEYNASSAFVRPQQVLSSRTARTRVQISIDDASLLLRDAEQGEGRCARHTGTETRAHRRREGTMGMPAKATDGAWCVPVVVVLALMVPASVWRRVRFNAVGVGCARCACAGVGTRAAPASPASHTHTRPITRRGRNIPYPPLGPCCGCAPRSTRGRGRTYP